LHIGEHWYRRTALCDLLQLGDEEVNKDRAYRGQVMDAQEPGFGVRVTETGHKTWILRTRFPGSSSASRREIGNVTDMTLTDAREKARALNQPISLSSSQPSSPSAST
jgi:hypothetical protein